MFTLVDYVMLCLVLILLVIIGVIVAFSDLGKFRILAVVAEIIIMVLITGGCFAYRTGTESGKRGLKSWKSETSGGLNRTVTVYDIKGKEIAKYTGRFDVEEDMLEGVIKVKFDNNGKRHIIYAQTGTVLIDEN